MAERCFRELPIDDARALDLQPVDDARGMLIELFRSDWNIAPVPQQWNLVRSRANTLRGVHVHLDHDDFLTVTQGRMHLGLHDIRPGSRTRGTSTLVTLEADHPIAVLVPRGVLHGFCFVEDSTYLYGLSACWSAADDLGCLWSDPGLRIAWPVRDPLVSERDRTAGNLETLERSLKSRWIAPA